MEKEIVEVTEEQMKLLIDFERLLERAGKIKTQIFDTLGCYKMNQKEIKEVQRLGMEYLEIRNGFTQLLAEKYEKIDLRVIPRLEGFKTELHQMSSVLENRIQERIRWNAGR